MSALGSNTPFLKPSPPRLSDHLDLLKRIEASGVFSNFGPVNTEFETRVVDELFGGEGHCVTVCNATVGLMLALRAQLEGRATQGGLALMPSFTFAATPHAAVWAGLTPLLCDIEPLAWRPCPDDERHLLSTFGREVAAIIPYATFGADLDLTRYDALARESAAALVVDAAASLGSIAQNGRAFGAGFPWPVVFSMHVTKTFSTSEAGLVYSADKAIIDRVRAMANFGFGEPRTATISGLNGKLSEIAAAIALLRLDGFDEIVDRRRLSYALYAQGLPECGFQVETCVRQAHQFVPVLLPTAASARREEIVESLGQVGIGTGRYFSPHVAEQPYFQRVARFDSLPVTDAVSQRCLSLPLSDQMTADEVVNVIQALRNALSGSGTDKRKARS
jgi:dTDP-4-amino-4,6-dideoxygalactose transaminase